MSYSAFKAEILGGLQTQHRDKTKASRVVSMAYTNLVLRHYETLTGAGQYFLASGMTAGLQAGLQAIFLKNLASEHNRISQYNLWAPYIYSYWAGATIPGPLGIAVVTGTGTWSGPPMPENKDPQLWLRVLTGVIASHITSLLGTYTNYYTGYTTPWSGGLLLTFP